MKTISSILGIISLLCFFVSLPHAGLWLAGERLTAQEQSRWPILLTIAFITGFASAFIYARAKRSRKRLGK